MEYSDLLHLATSIAQYMPNGWRVDRRPIDEDRHHMGARIIGDHHKALRIYQSHRRKGKVTVSGECPDYGLTWQEKRHAYLPTSGASIHVSPSRNPKHIASDIMRRLMPDYENMVIKAEDAVQKYKNSIAQMEQVEHALRCVTPDLRDYGDNRHSTSRRYHIYQSEDGGSFRSGTIEANVYGGLSCDMELRSVSIEKAVQILALLRD